eukprot:sb/3479221/
MKLTHWCRKQKKCCPFLSCCAETSKQPIRTRYLSHVTGYQPIRDQYFLIWSVPVLHTRVKCGSQFHITLHEHLISSLAFYFTATIDLSFMALQAE